MEINSLFETALNKTLMSIFLTETAVLKVKKLRADNWNFLRIRVMGGGCSGFQYDMRFESFSGEEDMLFNQDDLKILVDKKSMELLEGTTIHYEDGLNGEGFTFSNPRACRTCGCGKSFGG